MQSRLFIPPSRRRMVQFILLFTILLLFGAAAMIPFLFESPSIWYKFGVDKTMLRAGKIAALLAAVLLFCQILLALRLPQLDSIFGLDRVYFLHHGNGLLIMGLATAHALLVLLPEGISNLPIGWKFWPEMLGICLLLFLFIVVAGAQFRRKIFPYHRWRCYHRLSGYVLLAAMVIHIFFVSDSFAAGIPRTALFLFLCLVLAVVLITKYHYHGQCRRKWKLKEVTRLTPDVVSLIIISPLPFIYAPGQFVFISFPGRGAGAEAHPFTIASAPAAGELQFMIKRCGDWTSQLPAIAGSDVSLQGPFGLFSYLARPATKQMIFLAAGIGITPLLSMLRHICSTAEQPQITLIWSLRRKKDNFLATEMEKLRQSTPTLKTVLCFSQENNCGRLNREQLAKLVESHSRTASVYICGPQTMMEESRKSLIHLGFAKSNIFWERFSL